eukprot:4074932-Prymnesium_polylepis.2
MYYAIYVAPSRVCLVATSTLVTTSRGRASRWPIQHILGGAGASCESGATRPPGCRTRPASLVHGPAAPVYSWWRLAYYVSSQRQRHGLQGPPRHHGGLIDAARDAAGAANCSSSEVRMETTRVSMRCVPPVAARLGCSPSSSA